MMHPLVVVPRRGSRPGAGLLLASFAGAGAACAQCQPVWSAVEPPGQSFAMCVHDEDGPGPILPAIYMGDRQAHLTPSPNVNRFDGWSWQSVGEGLRWSEPVSITHVYCLLDCWDEPVAGLRGLLVGGLFDLSGFNPISKAIALWDGHAWQSVGPGIATGGIGIFASYDEDANGPGLTSLMVGGQLTAIYRDPSTRGIARWDGAQWSSVGGGLGPFVQTGPALSNDLAVYDEDGDGPAHPVLIVGGVFASAGGLSVYNLAKWDGVQWSTVGGCGVNGSVFSLAVYDEDGPGPARESLYVGGNFRYLRNDQGHVLDTGALARWDGQQWSALPGWTGGHVNVMTIFDEDGPGPVRPGLIIAGHSIKPYNVNHNGICKWDGQNYHHLGSGVGGFSEIVKTLCAFDEDGPGPNPGGLYVGGSFTLAGGVPTVGTARWGCPLRARCEADCDTSTGPGRLDTFDFLCFLNRFSYEDPWACDGDLSTGPRVCDVFDFLWFQNQYAGGCP